MKNVFGLNDGSGRCPACGMPNWLCAVAFVITPILAVIGIAVIVYMAQKGMIR